jgi:transposase
VFLDETGVNTSLTRLYGRAPRGQRLYDQVPLGRWKMTTVVAAIRSGGVLAPLAFEGATTEASFVHYLKRVLIPELREGDIVVRDNLPAHRAGAVGRAIRKAGAGVWYLPPYAPELNPIEKIWSKVKARVRKAAPRTQPTLDEALSQALQAVTDEDCRNCFAHCGYPATAICEAL